MYDGKLVRIPPSDPPHGERLAHVATLVAIHVGLDFAVALDLLIRTSKIDDFATDLSVYPEARDRATGRRQLDQLASCVTAGGGYLRWK